MKGYMIEYTDKRTDEVRKVFASEESYMRFLELINRHNLHYQVQKAELIEYDGVTQIIQADSYGYVMGYNKNGQYVKVFVPELLLNEYSQKACRDNKQLHTEDWTNTLILDPAIPVISV